MTHQGYVTPPDAERCPNTFDADQLPAPIRCFLRRGHAGGCTPVPPPNRTPDGERVAS
jgi:hypothetical protein